MNTLDLQEDISRPVRAIVVDDEALGRDLVARLAGGQENIDVVGQFADAGAALAAIERLHPELVFLDIRMPRLTGIEAARQIADSGIVVVFVTAFEEFALEAFEVQGFDYLVKPIEKDRFAAVCERVYSHVKRLRIEKVMGQAPAHRRPAQIPADAPRFRIRDGNRLRYLKAADVIWFEAANQYVNIHARQGTFLISTDSLNSLEDRLDPDQFVRVHRSSIVNIRYARCIRVDPAGAYFIEMCDGARVRVSRNHRGLLKELDI